MTTKVTKPLLADDSVGTSQVEDAAITNPKLGVDAVQTSNIGDDQVTQPKIGPAAVGSTELADDAVTAAKYADNSIPLAAITDGLITEPKLANQSVTEDKLGSASVTQTKLGLQSVDTVNYAPDSITSSILQNSSVITDKIDDNAVTWDKLQQANEGSVITYDNASTAIELGIGSEGSVLTVQNGRPAWSGSTVPVGTIVDYFGSNAPIGWIMIDGSTIGSPASTANYANNDVEDLYNHLWNNFADSIIAVAGGRGASANDDWTANKAMTLPDFVGRTTVMVDLDTETPSGTITTGTFSNGVSQVGGTGGAETVTLTDANIPDHRHHVFRNATATNPLYASQPATTPTSTLNNEASRWNGTLTDEHKHQHSYRMHYNNSYITPTVGMTSPPIDTNGATISTGTAVNKMQPSVLVLKIMKL